MAASGSQADPIQTMLRSLHNAAVDLLLPEGVLPLTCKDLQDWGIVVPARDLEQGRMQLDWRLWRHGPGGKDPVPLAVVAVIAWAIVHRELGTAPATDAHLATAKQVISELEAKTMTEKGCIRLVELIRDAQEARWGAKARKAAVKKQREKDATRIKRRRQAFITSINLTAMVIGAFVVGHFLEDRLLAAMGMMLVESLAVKAAKMAARRLDHDIRRRRMWIVIEAAITAGLAMVLLGITAVHIKDSKLVSNPATKSALMRVTLTAGMLAANLGLEAHEAIVMGRGGKWTGSAKLMGTLASLALYLALLGVGGVANQVTVFGLDWLLLILNQAFLFSRERITVEDPVLRP